jgi:hypothetical protein
VRHALRQHFASHPRASAIKQNGGHDAREVRARSPGH